MPELSRTPSYHYAESLLVSADSRRYYDEAKMHWIGDPDPEKRHDGRQPWVKRIHDDHEHVYSLPVLAAFSIARDSLLSIRKDPWHRDENPRAWFVAEHNLRTGEVWEPVVMSASVDAARQLWLQVADPVTFANWPQGKHVAHHAEPYNQWRYELKLDDSYHAAAAEYRAGTAPPMVQFDDMVGLESMMRLVSQARQLQLPQTVEPVSAHELARVA